MTTAVQPNSKTKLSDVPEYKQVYIPKSVYKHKITEVQFGLSKSANAPMFTLTVEIIDHPGFPNPKNPSEIVDVNGQDAVVYASLTEKALGNLKRLFKACGLPTDISLEELVANPNGEFLKGKTFSALGYSKADPQVDEITKQPIVNPFTGQPIVYYRYTVGEILAPQ